MFLSFTKAQYRNQDIGQPWTGEFYNGDTGQWKTAERDYNHSTWLDILIPELIGVVPRDDDVLEIDPLLPDDALSHFLLDGLRYHGHDVTIAWDSRRSPARLTGTATAGRGWMSTSTAGSRRRRPGSRGCGSSSPVEPGCIMASWG